MNRITSVIILCLFILSASAQNKVKFEPVKIGVTTKVRSAKLNETRTINIYLPEGYDANDTTKYPVIYVVDGGMQEDFVHLSGLVQYTTQPWVNRMPKSIVVGIENTNRKRDFTFTVANLDFLEKVGLEKKDLPQYGGSANYIAFIEQELQSFIRQNFRTNGVRTLIGESLGGLLATEIYARHRRMFDNYIIISPSLWWGNEVLLQEIGLGADMGKDVKVYVGAPSKDEMPMMYDDALQLSKVIEQHNSKTKVHFDYLPDETHATVIQQAAYNAFKWLGQP